MNDAPYDVIIAGAGPVGLVAALTLARRGARVALIEKRDSISSASRASTLHPPTLELLDSLDVLEEVHALGTVADRIQHRSPDGVLAEFHLSDLHKETRFPYRLHLEQSHVTPVLLKRLRALPNATVAFETELVDVAQDNEGVRVTARRDGGETVLRARYLLAADGSRSKVRDLLGLTFEGEVYPGRMLRLMMRDKPEDLVPGIAPVSYVHNGQRSISFLAMPDCWRMILRVGDVGDDIEAITEEWTLEQIQQVLPNAKAVPALVDRDLYSVSRRTASAFRDGRIYLAGDAAHITSTRGGMNMNCGVHDGAAMGRALGETLEHDDPSIADKASDERYRVATEMLIPRTDRSSKAGPAWTEHLQQTAADSASALAYLRSTAMLDMVEHGYLAD